MSLETATYIDALVTSNPDGADQRSTADDHLRLIKAALKRSFPQIGGPVSASAVAISYVNDLSASVQAQLNTLATGTGVLKASEALSASVAHHLGTTAVSAGAVARIDAGVAGNVFSSTPTVSNIQTFTGLSAYHRMWAKGANAGEQGWIVNYALNNAGQGRLIPVALTEDSGTFATTVIDVLRTISWVESITITVGESGKTTPVLRGIVNGTTYDLTNPTRMNSIGYGSWARRDAAQTFEGGQGMTTVPITYAASVTPAANDGNVFRLTLTGNVTINAPSSPRDGQCIVIILKQGGSGTYTASWSSSYKFAGGTAPTLTSGVGSKDVFSFVYDSTDAVWLQAGLDVS